MCVLDSLKRYFVCTSLPPHMHLISKKKNWYRQKKKKEELVQLGLRREGALQAQPLSAAGSTRPPAPIVVLNCWRNSLLPHVFLSLCQYSIMTKKKLVPFILVIAK